MSLFPSDAQGLDELRREIERAEKDLETRGTEQSGKEFSIKRETASAENDLTARETEYSNKGFDVKKVKNDEIEGNLGWAGRGSSIPESLWGIFWLDQNHKSSIGTDPDYLCNMPIKHVPSEETVVCFGDDPVTFNPDTQMIENCTAYGGKKGHWTMKDGALGQVEMNNAILTRMVGDFQFLSETHVKVIARIKIPLLDRWCSVPDSLFKMEMLKTFYGWNRITTIGPDLPNIIDHSPWLEKFLPPYIMRLAQVGEKGAMQYPVLQILDGDGNRTRYYQEYLDFVNQHCEHQLVGVERKAPPARPSAPSPSTPCCEGCTVS